MTSRAQSTHSPRKRSRLVKWKAAYGRFNWVFSSRVWIGVAVGYLMGRALPGSQTAPFGIAFFAALLDSGFSPMKALPVGVAIMAGVATVTPVEGTRQLLWIAAALLVCHASAGALGLGGRKTAGLRAAGLAAAVTAIPSIVAYASSSVFRVSFWPIMVGILVLVFNPGLSSLMSGRWRNGHDQFPASVFLVGACAMVGLDGVTLGFLSVREAVAALLVLASAQAGGTRLATAAASVVGFVALLSVLGGTAGSWRVEASVPVLLAQANSMAYVVAGFLAGQFKRLSRFAVTVSFSLALTAYASLFAPSQAVGLLYGTGIAAGLFLLVPGRWLESLGTTLAEGDGQSENLPGYTPEPSSDESVERIRSMASALREMTRTFDQVAAVRSVHEVAPEQLVSQAQDRVCSSCSLYHQCWERETEITSGLFRGLWTRIDEHGPLDACALPDALKEHCIYPAEAALALNYLHGLHQANRFWRRRVEEGRSLAGEYVRNVARTLERLAGDFPDSKARSENTPVFEVVAGVARLPKRGGHISGDSFSTCSLSADRYMMALSDGMGVGQGAAAESRQCINLLQALLNAGFATDVAVTTLNSFLLLRTPEESFATADLTLMDLTTGRAEFVKIGAAPSFIKRGPDVTVIKVPSVPIGIVSEVLVEPEYRSLRAGDLVVMITDGIWDISKVESDKERWIIDHLAKEEATDPSEIAESLLARAMESTPDASDDMTVLVARVDLNGKGPEREQRPGLEWAPARSALRSESKSESRSRK